MTLPAQNYIKTDVEPAIYYLPKVMNDATNARVRSQQADVLPPLIAQLNSLLASPVQVGSLAFFLMMAE